MDFVLYFMTITYFVRVINNSEKWLLRIVKNVKAILENLDDAQLFSLAMKTET